MRTSRSLIICRSLLWGGGLDLIPLNFPLGCLLLVWGGLLGGVPPSRGVPPSWGGLLGGGVSFLGGVTSQFWEVAGTYEWYFVILWLQVDLWGHSNPTWCNWIDLNFLLSELVGMLKYYYYACSHLRARLRSRATLWKFHNI